MPPHPLPARRKFLRASAAAKRERARGRATAQRFDRHREEVKAYIALVHKLKLSPLQDASVLADLQRLGERITRPYVPKK